MNVDLKRDYHQILVYSYNEHLCAVIVWALPFGPQLVPRFFGCFRYDCTSFWHGVQIHYLSKNSFYGTITLPQVIDTALRTINELGSLVSRNTIQGPAHASQLCESSLMLMPLSCDY